METPAAETLELGDFVHDHTSVPDPKTLALVVFIHDPQYANDLYIIRYFEDGHIGHRMGKHLVKMERAEAVKILCKNAIEYGG